MTPSKIFLYLLLSFILGVFISSFLDVPRIILYELFGLGIFYIASSNILARALARKAIIVFGVCLIIFASGIFRYQIADSKIKNNKLIRYQNQEVSLQGKVSKEPDVRRTNTKLTLKIQSLNRVAASGKILITARTSPKYQYGDELEVAGLLKQPRVFEDFNYRDYLKKDGISAVMSYPKIKVISKNRGNIIYSKILSFKQKLRDVVYQNLIPPESSILGAIILGDKRKISQEWKNKLNITGVRHITAVSGMHIVILTGVLMTLLIGLGLWRNQAFYFTIILVWLFILMAGVQSSAIRAGVMGSLFLLGQRLERVSASSRAIIFAAFLMLLINPFLLRFDVGFQLSFLAVFGIIYLGPVFKNLLKFIPEKDFFNLRSILVMTFSAQVFTLPILVYNFGYFSLVGPFSNILILPLIYWIMLFGFIFALFGALYQPLGFIFSFPVFLLLKYLTSVVNFFSQIPWASKTLTISWLWLPVCYLALGFFILYLQRIQKLKFLDY